MYIHQLSLTNQRIRNALKEYDSSTLTKAVLILLNGDHEKADKLGTWFKLVASNCQDGLHLNEDVAMMRMWQLGNVDIKEVEDNGEPVFVLTYSGSEIVKALPEELWFAALLKDNRFKAAS